MTVEARAIGRALAVTAGAIALAALSWMSASDRAAADSMEPGRAFLGGDAAAQHAFALLVDKRPEEALVEARRAVRTEPTDASATSALASTLLALGRPDQAYAAFSVAGVLGWRDIPTQFYWLAQAEAAGDVNIVTQRLDALLRLNIDNDAVVNSLHLLEQTPVGQRALAALLVQDPPWESRFLARTGDLDGADLEGRMAAINLAARQGATIDCDAIGIAANRLVTNDHADAARQLWRQSCERSSAALLSNGGFETDPSTTPRNPFGWQLQSSGGLDVAVAPAPSPLKGQALRISSSRTSRTMAALQLTALQPGGYRISWTAVRGNGAPDSDIDMLVRCGRSGGLIELEAARRPDQPTRAAATFFVPPDGCPIQTIGVQKGASAPGETQTGWIDNVMVVPLDSTDAGNRWRALGVHRGGCRFSTRTLGPRHC